MGGSIVYSEIIDLCFVSLIFLNDKRIKHAISMEKGCKSHKETLNSSKGKIVYVVGKPCNIYRLRGNPIVIIGIPRNIQNLSL
jgi:hypothetical protein